MATRTLGKLERVDLRELWQDEARDFTSWLASSEGLTLLGDTIGIELELVGQEQRVGLFKADLLARDLGEEDHLIVIENQLEKTNHDHLGKIITYAAGLGASTVVWIAETFTDEHRQAMDWLNENAGERLAFFGLQVEAWKIGDSLPAPQLKMVSSPNEWTRAVKVDETREVTETKSDQLHFWEEVQEYGHNQSMTLQFRKPRPQHRYNIAVGRSGFSIALTVNSFQRRVGCEVFMRRPHAKQAFDQLSSQAQAIESEIGQKLEWQRLEGKKGSRIVVYHTGVLIDNPTQREEAKEWLCHMAEKFHKVFAPRIQALKLDTEGSDDEGEEDNNG